MLASAYTLAHDAVLAMSGDLCSREGGERGGQIIHTQMEKRCVNAESVLDNPNNEWESMCGSV